MDDSSIVKSGSSDIVGQSRSVSDLLPIDNSTESTAITPEQLQSIRNGLSTTIVLTEQIVQVLSKGNDLLSRDIKKVRNLKRRVRRQIPTTGLLGSKFATDLLKKPVSAAKGAATPLAGALALEAAANLLDDDKIETTTQNFDTYDNVLSYPLKEAREQFEKSYLTSQLKKHKGNISKTAEFIGMERSALHRKLKTLGVKGVN